MSDPADRHPLDAGLAAAIMARAGTTDALVRDALVALSAAAREGSVALDRTELIAAIGADPTEALRRDAILGGPEDGDRPVALDGPRLYLRRWYEAEHHVAAHLARRAERVGSLGTVPGGVGDDQAAAVANALSRRLSVVTGGPGTGKTFTVVRILAAVIAARPEARVRLLAPTGKAAARLQAAVAQASTDLSPEVAARIDVRANTLHSALGIGRYRDDARILGDDVVVVDEFSMAGLELVERLLRSLSPHTRLVLVGDADQLPPVETGDALDALVRASAVPGSSVDGVAVALTVNRRTDVPAITRLTAAIRAGDADETLVALREGGDAIVLAQPPPVGQLGTELRAVVRARYGALPTETAPDAFAVLERFRVLCAHRHGPWGVVRLNALIEAELATMRLRPWGRSYAGRPILVTENEYGLGLYNGDLGVLLRDASGLRAWFDDPSGPRPLAPGRLPAHETAFALTVHKTQGSEADEVAVVLPPEDSPLLTRELLYTAVTRARKRVILLGTEAIVRSAVSRPRKRTSGLFETLTSQGAR
jgi:exodeoxyribonuclease V alpha subunit